MDPYSSPCLIPNNNPHDQGCYVGDQVGDYYKGVFRGILGF